MRRIGLLSLIFLLVATFAIALNSNSLRESVLGTSAGLADSPWPMYLGGPQHGGLSTVDTSHIDGTIKWKFETGAGIESSPAVGADGTIYVGSHDNKLYAVNPDGTEKWNFPAGETVYIDDFDVIKGIVSSPAVAADGTIYFSSLADYFFAINPDGTQKWRIKLPFSADTWTSPAIGPDGTIYTGAARRFTEGTTEVFDPRDLGGLYAINPDGTVKWHESTGGDVAPSPAIAPDGTVYYGTYGTVDEGFLVAVNSQGEEKWRFNTGGLIESSAAIAPDGTVYVGSKSGRVYALNPDGTEKWYFEVDPAYISEVPEEKRENVDEYHLNGVSAVPAIGADGTVYIGAWNSYFYALSPKGALKWKFKVPVAFEGIVSSAAIGAEGTVYVGSNSGVFYALNPDGTEKWSYDVKASMPSSPAIGPDGTVYVGAWDKNLYAFGGSGKDNIVAEFGQDVQQTVSGKLPSVKNIAIGFIAILVIGGLIVLLKKGKLNKKWLVLIPLLILIIGIVLVILNSLKGSKGSDFARVGSKVFENIKPKKNPENICLTNEEYDEVTDPNAPVLSIPFDIENYSTKHWGIVPFCAELRGGQMHGAFDFELKPDSKVYSSTDGVVDHTQVGKEEGSGEIIAVNGDGFSLGYSGLTNLQVKAGDRIKRGDYIADAVLIPHGEHHVHLGIMIDGKNECPLKYMDEEFRQAFEQMFAQANYSSQTDAPCACNCESYTPNY